MPRQQTVATYFKSLKLRNIRCFEDVALDLTDENGNLAQWTLILGDNGVGKTTLLQCLVWMRPVLKNFVENDDPENPLKPITIGKIGCALEDEEDEYLERLLTIKGEPRFDMMAEIFQGENLIFGTQPSSQEIKTKVISYFDNRGFLKAFKQTKTNIEKISNKKFWSPFIVAYGANRQIGFQNTTKTSLIDPDLAKNLSDFTELYDAVERLTELNNAATNNKYERTKKNEEDNEESTAEKLLVAFKEAVTKILPNDLKGLGKIEIEASDVVNGKLKKSTVKLKTNNVSVPLNDLSLGYKTTLTWALDLAWRLFSHYPKSDDPLEEPAIVLIDEIDLHLHPRWQREIMEKLAGVFKGTQFIATAHSPLMVQSMPNANFAIVHKIGNKFVVENEPQQIKGWRVDQILNSEYFNVQESRPPEDEKLFKERSKLLLKIERNLEEDKRLQNLQEQISLLPTGSFPPHESDAAHLLRRVTELLEKNQPKEK